MKIESIPRRVICPWWKICDNGEGGHKKRAKSDYDFALFLPLALPQGLEPWTL